MDITAEQAALDAGYDEYQIAFVKRAMRKGISVEQACSSINRSVYRLAAPNTRAETSQYRAEKSMTIVRSLWKILSGNVNPSEVSKLKIRAPQLGI